MYDPLYFMTLALLFFGLGGSVTSAEEEFYIVY